MRDWKDETDPPSPSVSFSFASAQLAKSKHQAGYIFFTCEVTWLECGWSDWSGWVVFSSNWNWDFPFSDKPSTNVLCTSSNDFSWTHFRIHLKSLTCVGPVIDLNSKARQAFDCHEEKKKNWDIEKRLFWGKRIYQQANNTFIVLFVTHQNPHGQANLDCFVQLGRSEKKNLCKESLMSKHFYAFGGNLNQNTTISV